jgi:hypothetical protein
MADRSEEYLQLIQALLSCPSGQENVGEVK